MFSDVNISPNVEFEHNSAFAFAEEENNLLSIKPDFLLSLPSVQFDGDYNLDGILVQLVPLLDNGKFVYG